MQRRKELYERRDGSMLLFFSAARSRFSWTLIVDPWGGLDRDEMTTQNGSSGTDGACNDIGS